MRPIDADALLVFLDETIEDTNPEHFDLDKKESFGFWMHANGFNCAITSAELAIMTEPTVEAVPVVHCSECYLHGVCGIEAQLKQFGQSPETAHCSMGSRT